MIQQRFAERVAPSKHGPTPATREAVRAEFATLAQKGHEDAAADLLERWLADHLNDHELWLWLGDLRRRTGAFDAAIEALENASRAAPPLDHAALLRLGALHLETADARRARETFHSALARLPQSAEARCGLAAAAAQLGDFESVRREASAAVALDPHCYTAWYQLTQVPGGADAGAEAMQRAVREAGEDPQAWLLYLAFGRVQERAGDFDAAFRAYSEGQQRRARFFSIDYARQERFFSRVRLYMDSTFVRRRPERVDPDFRPIFIIGMPRSGTTLVEAVLDAHPAVAAGGEMRFLYDWIRRNAIPAQDDALTRLARAEDRVLARLAAEWREAFDRVGGPEKRVTDKFPLNFTVAGLLALCFPGASIVHVQRDPRDTCVSCYTTALDGNMAPATLTDLGAFYRDHEELMRHWRSVLGEERIVEIKYEDLVHTPEPVVRRLLADVGLPWDPRCLAFHESPRPVATASVYQVRQPIYSHSIGRWKRFERHLGPLFESLAGPSRH